MIAEAYECLATMWQDRHILATWKWKWLVPIPKTSSRRIQDISPIMLMEVLRKLWTGLLVDEVTSSLQRHSALSLSQHEALLSLQFSGISIPAYVVSIPSTPATKNTFK